MSWIRDGMLSAARGGKGREERVLSDSEPKLKGDETYLVFGTFSL